MHEDFSRVLLGGSYGLVCVCGGGVQKGPDGGIFETDRQAIKQADRQAVSHASRQTKSTCLTSGGMCSFKFPFTGRDRLGERMIAS